MDQSFILGKLSRVMGWEDNIAQTEFARTRLMADLKFDSYQGFLAGARFIERLVDWLQQFPLEKRKAAYGFVRDRLIYITAAQMNHLVELFLPETVEPRLVSSVAARFKMPRYQVWADATASAEFVRQLRKTLFVALSDGGRIDVLRRANAGVVSNEQIVTSPQIHHEKWTDLLRDLRLDVHDANERFAFLFLVDDFTASGTSLIRKPRDQWKGKLVRFWESIRELLPTHFEDEFTLHVHHFLATGSAKKKIQERANEISKELVGTDRGWFQPNQIEFSYGNILPDDVQIDESRDPDFWELVDTFYDASLDRERERHIKQCGIDTLRYGYGDCRLPIVLDHNTPNNTFPLIWYESGDNADGHAMRALFQRRERHM